MIREVLSSVDYGLATQVSLLIFVCVFVAVIVRTIRRDRQEIETLASMALRDSHADDAGKEGGARHGRA